MKLYNQTKNQLRWQIANKSFTCSPYGDVDVPDDLVEHCKHRGLPLAVTSVAPEVKASDAMKSASESAKNDEVFNLTKQLNEAIASEKVAKEQLENSLLANTELKNKLSVANLDLNNEKIKSSKLIEDYGAMSKLLEETSKELEIAKQERDLAKKTIEQSQSAKQPAQQKAK